jgi:hypothetical protein
VAALFVCVSRSVSVHSALPETGLLLCERAQQEFATRMTLIVAIGISERPLIYV